MPHILAPGEEVRPARPDHAIALGAALLIVDLPGLPPEFDMVAVAAANPWAVVAALRPRDRGIIPVLKRHAPLRELVELDCPEEGWEPRLRKELADLGPPTPKEVVDYISAACPGETFQRALLAELSGHSRPGRSARHSAFSRCGPLTANGWMGLYMVIRFLSLPGRPSLNDAAMMLGVDPRTLRGHCQKILELDGRDARKGFGWKWAVERTLRLHGYVADDPPLPLAFRGSYPVSRMPREDRGVG